MGQTGGSKPETLEAVVPTASGFGLPDDPGVLPAIPKGLLYQDLDKRPLRTNASIDMTIE